MGRELSVVVEGMTFLESPRWHDGRLWFSDFYTQRVMAVTPGGDPEEILSVPNQPSGLGWLPDGRMLVVSMKDRRLLRRESSVSSWSTPTFGHRHRARQRHGRQRLRHGLRRQLRLRPDVGGGAPDGRRWPGSIPTAR